MTVNVEPPLQSRPRARRVAAAVVIGGLTLVLVGLFVRLDGVQVQSQQELAHVGFGMPLSWVVQDQSIDPPLPYRTRFLSPWQNPTRIDVVPLVGDVLVVGLGLAGAWYVVSVARSRRSPK